MRYLMLAVLAGFGCGGGTPATPDAAHDAPPGPMCTGAIYDNCVTNSQCMSANCHFYGTSNFTICTTTCTPGDNTTCPVDSSGAHGTCNTMGNCKPAAPNNCHL
jgi:hypothetical protein